MQRGLTLPELLLAIVIACLTMAIALPGIQAFRDRLMVTEEVQRLISAHRRARVAAILQSQPLVLVVSADSLSISTVEGHDVVWAASGPLSRGVDLAGGERHFVFSPVGITTGVSNASLTLSRGNATRTIVISRLGRVRVQ
ncbi:MAG: GspH/FimT family pseudopilin [Gemmatimonadales bacterium]